MTHRRRIHSNEAPAPIGPYSQAVEAGGLVFCSGQIALRSDGSLQAGGVSEEVGVVLANLVAVLAAAGCRPSDVVRTTIYLVDMADFGVVNEAYGRVFDGEPPPARSTVAVAALPRGARVEIDAIALRD